MIYPSMELIRQRLQDYITTSGLADAWPVILGNIAFAPSGGDGIYISLVNIEQDQTSRNTIGIRQPGASLTPAPLTINLYILFTAHLADYGLALQHLTLVLQFFHDTSVLPVTQDGKTITVTIEPATLTMEQVDQLWCTLGGKQEPFALYRVRQVQL